MKLNELINELKDRIEELEIDIREEVNHNNNHRVSMMIGEIGGINFVLEKISEVSDESKI